MYKISKDFSLCYGHRVWTQELKEEFCQDGDTSCKCKHLHGHEGLIRVALEANLLTKGMVTDFKHLGWVKNFLDDNLDHKFIIDKNDPLFYNIVGIEKDVLDDNLERVFLDGIVVGWKITTVPNNLMAELFDSFFIVDFTPTSENLAGWLYDIVMKKMVTFYPGVRVESIMWQETPKSKAFYTEHKPGDGFI